MWQFSGRSPIFKAALEPAAASRSGGKAKVGIKLVALTALQVPAWEADKLPPHLRNIPAVKPGSRGLA